MRAPYLFRPGACFRPGARSWPFALPLPRLPGPSLMSTVEPAVPPAVEDVPPVPAVAVPVPLALLVAPGIAFMPGRLLGARTVVPWVLLVFCDAVVD